MNQTNPALCRKMGKDPSCFPGAKQPVCANPGKATVCDPSERTVNLGAKCGAADDFYYFSPWRNPGSAPVLDACGSAGGRRTGQGHGNFGAAYVDTLHAKVGDLGSTLPAAPSGVTWQAGQTVEVSWALQANHGGGYSWRLCPSDAPLTEECFQNTPLKFTGRSSLRWGGREGVRQYFDAVYVNGTGGSQWARNPIPRGVNGDRRQTGLSFPPVCKEDPRCRKEISEDYRCCSGDGETGLGNLEIVDSVILPKTLAPGKYVVGFRWDCEESNQVWSSCSDVEITSA